MKPASAVLLALSAPFATGNPILGKHVDPALRKDMGEDSDPTWPSKEVYCDWDLTTPGAVQDRWDEYGISGTMDLFLTTYDMDEVLDKNWLNEWVDKIDTDGGREGASGCGSIGGHCDPTNGVSCHKFVEMAEEDSGYKNYQVRDAYWVFQAVKALHSKFGELSRLMTMDTVVTGFRIPEMIKAFTGKDDGGSDFLSWIAAAIGMGGSVAGAIPGPGPAVSAGAGILSGIISQVIADGEGPVDAGDMATGLIDAFVAASDALERTLKIVTGLGKTEQDFLTLPAPIHDTYRSKITKFFNGGWWLLNDDSTVVQDLFASVKWNLQRKIASDIMNGADWKLIVDLRAEVASEEKCRTQRGRHWLEYEDGVFSCFYIAKVGIERGGLSDRPDVEEAGEELYDSMKKYGFDGEEDYYRDVLDCAVNGNDEKELDVSNVSFGSTPTCYFKLVTMLYEHSHRHLKPV